MERLNAKVILRRIEHGSVEPLSRACYLPPNIEEVTGMLTIC
jgi:hypothetical protein